MGSYPGDGPEAEANAERDGFDAVVRCAAELPNLYPLEDVPRITGTQLVLFLRAAQDVAARLKDGEKVLVTCAAGINRSALVAGLAMVMHFQIDGAKAYSTIRKARKCPDGGQALRNTGFANFLIGYESL